MHSQYIVGGSNTKRQVIIDIEEFFKFSIDEVAEYCGDQSLWTALRERVCASLDGIFAIMMLDTHTIWELRYDSDVTDDFFLVLSREVYAHINARCEESGGRIIKTVTLPASDDSDADELSGSDWLGENGDSGLDESYDPYAGFE